MDYIAENVYKEILELMPVLCIDLIIFNDEKEILLVKRKNNPEKDKWWFPGGRLRKNEKLKDAVIRIARDETGLDVMRVKLVGAYDYMCEKSHFDGLKTGVHTPTIVFLVKTLKVNSVKVDDNHSGYRWINSLDKNNYAEYVKEVITESEIWK